MSYEICYGRNFIRTTRGILPMILSGSNNCTEIKYDGRGRQYERRERHWWAWVPRPLDVADHPVDAYRNAISDIVAGYNGDDHELMRWNGKWMCVSQWWTWFYNACKSAKTLEDYLHDNRGESFKCSLAIWKGYDRTTELDQYIHTTPELESWLDMATAHKAALLSENPDLTVYICTEFTGDEPLKAGSRNIQGKVVAKIGNAYVKAYTNSSISMSGLAADAVVFDNEEDAYSKLGRHWHNLRLVKAGPQMRERPFILRLQGGNNAGRYVRNVGGRYLYPTSAQHDAKHFLSVKEAESFFRRIAVRFRIGTTATIVDVRDGSSTQISTAEDASASA